MSAGRDTQRRVCPVNRRSRGLTLLSVSAVVIAAGCSAADIGDESDASAEESTTSRADGSTTGADAATDGPFYRLATYPVYENRPDGTAITDETVAEISAAADEGRTMIYTDAAGKRIGFVDLSNPSAPTGDGTFDLAELGNADDQPTSVGVAGDQVLVVIDQTGDNYSEPSGRVDIVDLASRTATATIDLEGQPDSIAISPDGTFAAIAIENQRDEEFTPEGGEEGDLPQPPTGFVQLIDLDGDPKDWSARRVDFDIDQARDAGLDTPEDLEPEYVSINSAGQVAVTLQENNGVAIIDGAAGEVTSIFSTGTADLEQIDTDNNGTISQTDSLSDVPREPDAIAWLDDTRVATANEGDWKGGSRGWSVFDAESGDLVWDSGNELGHLAVEYGLHNEDRADAKGTEPEGIAVANFNGTPVALVGSERSNFVAAYDVTDPTSPQLLQILPTTNGPEGILPIPGRNLVAISSEVDDAEAGVRSSISLYGYGDDYAADGGTPQFPSIVSGNDADGLPIGWGALGALSADPDDANRLYTATDNAYGPARILGVDISQTPAVIDTELPITDAGADLTLDIEGIAARPGGGFYLAVEGEEGPDNQVVVVDADGAITERISLPEDVSAGIGSQGLEGISIEHAGDDERIWVAVQREVEGDPAGVVRLGRYNPADQQWAWFGYPLESTDVPDAWVGVSEIVVDGDRLLVLERDNLNGPQAAIKRIYSVPLPADDDAGSLDPLTKTEVVDLLPDLQAGHGWVQEKAEGMTVGADDTIYVVTDNDGLDDATGETVFLRLQQ